ncbi:MAG: sulfotransferase-like domain-containing protein [Planctomycetota bacterium]|jgi:hypothetical protein
MPIRIAMWSGPRNISTALMRSWGNRPDTWVCDEPLYAHYLSVTRLDHPGAREVIEHHESDWRKVVEWLTGPVPEGRPIFYQKHMAHHLLPEIDRGWLDDVSNCFLIRDPGQMLTSLVRFLPDPTIRDTGLPQQVEIFRRRQQHADTTPPVLDAKDVLEDPRRLLTLLCERLGVAFTDAMLSWPPGRRATDGIWARHWYEAVEASTSFKPYAAKPDPVPDRLADLYDECMSYYEQLYAHRLGQ